ISPKWPNFRTIADIPRFGLCVNVNQQPRCRKSGPEADFGTLCPAASHPFLSFGGKYAQMSREKFFYHIRFSRINSLWGVRCPLSVEICDLRSSHQQTPTLPLFRKMN